MWGSDAPAHADDTHPRLPPTSKHCPPPSPNTCTQSRGTPSRAAPRTPPVRTRAPPVLQVGGLGDVVTGLARASLQRGHKVTVMLPFYESLPLDQVMDLKHEMDLDVPKGRFWDGQMEYSE